jgi:transcriptional regulator with XRE-family HTH domain
MDDERRWYAFWEWVNARREAAGLAWYRMEERGGVANATLLRRFRVKARATPENMEAIAKGLDVSMREVLEQAGIIEPLEAQVVDDSLAGLLQLARTLTPAERRAALDYLRWHFRRESVDRDANAGAAGENRGAKRA